jgi:integrase
MVIRSAISHRRPMGSIRRGPARRVEDRWTKTVRDGNGTSSRVPSATNGKGKRWRARYVDDAGNEHAKGFDRKADATAWLDGVTSSIVQGAHVAPSAGKGTVSDLGVAWFASQAHIKETTRATRRSAWDHHVEVRWGRYAVRDVKTTGIRTWVAELVQGGAKPATIENALGALRMALELAVEDRQIARNPCTGVKAPRREHVDRGYLTHAQVHELAADVSSNSIVVLFLAYTGLRWGEMAALRVENFEMLRRRVNVVRAVAEVRGKLVWSTPKTHERRSVPFPKFLAGQLAELMAGKSGGDLVFTSVRGEVLRVSTYRAKVFSPAVETLGLQALGDRERQRASLGEAVTPEFPRVTPHDLRHTAASLAISAGANVKAVQLMLGHKSAAMTLDTYADLFPDDLDSVSDALDEAVRRMHEPGADALRTEIQERPHSVSRVGP